jgi:hypothetical protein
VSAFQAALGEQITRLRVLWPVLNSRPEHTQEIERAVTRHERKLTADDVTQGFSDAIEACPTTGWPPGPHEILGCVMARAHTRDLAEGPRRRSYGVGMTFHEWWQTVPISERPRHAALHRLMTKEETPLHVIEEKPVPATPMPEDDDDIEWEEAA